MLRVVWDSYEGLGHSDRHPQSRECMSCRVFQRVLLHDFRLSCSRVRSVIREQRVCMPYTLCARRSQERRRKARKLSKNSVSPEIHRTLRLPVYFEVVSYEFSGFLSRRLFPPRAVCTLRQWSKLYFNVAITIEMSIHYLIHGYVRVGPSRQYLESNRSGERPTLFTVKCNDFLLINIFAKFWCINVRAVPVAWCRNDENLILYNSFGFQNFQYQRPVRRCRAHGNEL